MLHLLHQAAVCHGGQGEQEPRSDWTLRLAQKHTTLHDALVATARERSRRKMAHKNLILMHVLKANCEQRGKSMLPLLRQL